MRLSSKLTRMAATLLATAMLACTAALPASADELDTGVTAGNEVTINTVFTIPAKVNTPNVTFTYTVATATATASEKDGNNDVKDGVAEGVYFSKNEKDEKVLMGDVTFTPATPIDTGAGKGTFEEVHTVTQNVTLNVDSSVFTSAGIYKYTITQSLKNENTNVTLDTNYIKTLYVYVTESEGEDETLTRTVAYTKLFNTNTAEGKTDHFTAAYLSGYTPDSDEGTLLLSKTVTGDFGDKNKDFSFNVSVTPATTDNTYYYEVGSIGENGTFKANETQNKQDQVISATDTTISLKHNQAIKIYGLVVGDFYSINETSGGKDGYTTTAKVNDVDASFAAIEDPETGETVVQYAVGNTIAANEESEVEQVKVAYTNNRISTTPTGVVMNVAPYILLVIIAVAGAFVFLRKRRED